MKPFQSHLEALCGAVDVAMVLHFLKYSVVPIKYSHRVETIGFIVDAWKSFILPAKYERDSQHLIYVAKIFIVDCQLK
jgi:hypothetical protein